MSFSRQKILVFLFPLLLAAPFLNRAYFVDDSYFVEIASWLKDHPGQPYHFRTDDAALQSRGWEENGFVRMVNPLVHHYFLAGLLKIGGEREWFLRLGCVLLSCFSALFIFELARRWTYHPLLTTLLVLATPVHWLTSYSLLIDGTAGFLFFGALYFFIRMGETDSLAWAVASGIFMGLAILTKYPTGFIIPLTMLWAYLRRKKIKTRWMVFVPWVIGTLFLIAYSVWTAHLYGRPHILAASGRMVQVYGWTKILVFLVFFSGSMLVPLVGWSFVGTRIRILFGILVITTAAFLMGPSGGFTLLQSFLIGLWSVTSLVFLLAVLSAFDLWEKPKDLFLFLWTVGFIGMMLIVMGWVAVRYYVIVVPAVVMMSVRLLEMRNREKAESRLLPILFLTILFSGLLAYADYKQAEPSRLVPAELEKAGYTGGERHFFLGDSFTMSYLKRTGWVPCFPETEFKKGDWVLAKEVTMPQVWFYRKPLVLKEIAKFNYSTRFPLKVMDNQGSAGFYASVWGALPFTFSNSPWERFHLFEIVEVRK